MSPVRAIILGGLTVGTLDILDASVFFGLRNGVTPLRIFQSTAAGIFGRESFQMGWRSEALGLFLHYFIALSIVTVFFLASRKLTWLVRRPLLAGLFYGIAVYFFMNYVVIPLSAANRGAFNPAVFANGILIHLFGVGLPSALFARRVPLT